MGRYAVTGSASGMGREVVDRLRAAGHDVVTIDLRDADVVADLSTGQGRVTAAEEVLARVDHRLDGAVLAAGVGPVRGRERLLVEVNYFGAVDLLSRWRSALAAPGDAKVVVFSSNSTTATPLVPRRLVSRLLEGDAEGAVRTLRKFRGLGASLAYGGSKIALSRWLRRTAVSPEWAGAGIRLNAIAPGAIRTPLLEQQLADSRQRRAIESFPIPLGGYGDAGQVADWVMLMLSPAADFMTGSVVFVDGGTDAFFRADDWPRAVPLRSLPSYVRRMREFARR